MKGKRARVGPGDAEAIGLDLSLSRTLAEQGAAMDGVLAMLKLQKAERTGQPARGAFHALRCAARIDPNAAYNLGNYLAGSIDTGPRRPRRRAMSLGLFERAATEGMRRLLDASAPFERAPAREREVRDIVSRALTNIGAAVSNLGRPEKAVTYFRRAIRMFPGNANAHVCLGTMGVHHGDVTGIDALAGIASWEEAARLGDSCHESAEGCPCRATVARIARQVERDYGADAAREWLISHFRTPGKKGTDFAPAAARAADAARLTGTAWPAAAVEVADLLDPVLADLSDLALEVKVTLAGSLVASLCRLPSRKRRGHARVLAEAVERAHGVEPLHPFLGDAEWRDLGPPDTDYLLQTAMRDVLAPQVGGMLTLLVSELPGLGPDDAVLGALFHLDRGFRRGVAAMAERALDGAPRDAQVLYVPATVIGSPARH